jgi:predicted MFS family arabinose efflux permease
MQFKGLEAFRSTSRDVKLLIAGSFFMGFGFTGFGLILNVYLKKLGFGEADIGSWLSYKTWATMAMTIPAAFLIRRLNLKLIMFISMVFVTLGSVVIILWPEFLYIALGMIVTGVFGAFSGVIGGPMIMKGSSDEARPYLFSINSAIGFVSGILGNLLAGSLPDMLKGLKVELIDGYKISLLVHVAIAFLAVIPFMMIKAERVVENQGKHFFHIKTPISRLLLLSTPHILVGLGAGLSIPFLNLYFTDRFHMTSTDLGILFSVSQVVMIVGTLAAPYFAERWGNIKTVIVFQLLSVPFLYLLSLILNVWVSIVAFLVRSTLMNMAQPLVTNFSLKMTEEQDHPLMSGVMTVAWLASWGISANLGGWLIQHKGYFLPFNLTVAAYILSSAVYFFVLLPMEKRSLSTKVTL